MSGGRNSVRGTYKPTLHQCQLIRPPDTQSEHSNYQQQRLEYSGVPTIGVGAGARSYAPQLHYCLPYRVNPNSIIDIIDNYISESPRGLKYDGFRFNNDDLKRKHVTLSLLDPGISCSYYKEKFNSDLKEDFKNEIDALFELKFIEALDDSIILTKLGRQYSDIAVEVFQSQNVSDLYSGYALK